MYGAIAYHCYARVMARGAFTYGETRTSKQLHAGIDKQNIAGNTAAQIACQKNG
jgi:hypothetical protein